MTLLVELPRKHRLARRFVKEAVISRESEQQIIDFYREEVDVSMRMGEPIARRSDPNLEVTIASAEDIQKRRDEQIERVIWSLAIGTPLTHTERQYISRVKLSPNQAEDLVNIR